MHRDFPNGNTLALQWAETFKDIPEESISFLQGNVLESPFRVFSPNPLILFSMYEWRKCALTVSPATGQQRRKNERDAVPARKLICQDLRTGSPARSFSVIFQERESKVAEIFDIDELRELKHVNPPRSTSVQQGGRHTYEAGRLLEKGGILVLIWKLDHPTGNAPWVQKLRDIYAQHDNDVPHYRTGKWEEVFTQPELGKGRWTRVGRECFTTTLRTEKEIVAKVLSKTNSEAPPRRFSSDYSRANIHTILSDLMSTGQSMPRVGGFEFPYCIGVVWLDMGQYAPTLAVKRVGYIMSTSALPNELCEQITRFGVLRHNAFHLLLVNKFFHSTVLNLVNPLQHTTPVSTFIASELERINLTIEASDPNRIPLYEPDWQLKLSTATGFLRSKSYFLLTDNTVFSINDIYYPASSIPSVARQLVLQNALGAPWYNMSIEDFCIVRLQGEEEKRFFLELYKPRNRAIQKRHGVGLDVSVSGDGFDLVVAGRRVGTKLFAKDGLTDTQFGVHVLEQADEQVTICSMVVDMGQYPPNTGNGKKIAVCNSGSTTRDFFRPVTGPPTTARGAVRCSGLGIFEDLRCDHGIN
ncbi:hypothetical protein BJ742DRAFT_739358 [Cladochytrium replicatum]|nr:hypothetical protein BJ742DRAFT_739358 [Cladochytrium replicatum]